MAWVSWSAAFAFLHHAAALTIFITLAIELVLLKVELTRDTARSLLRMDAIYGIAAVVILVVGLTRVTYFEKGPAYYFHSGTFLAKLSLFLIVGLLSIYPTLQFLRWRKPLAAGQLPAVEPAVLRKMRMLVHIELALLAVIVFLAVLMARGIGYFG
jgi:putative membrane protein